MINNISKSQGVSKYSLGKNTITAVNIPDFPKMRTSSQCKLSEEELVSKITKLAQRDAAAGKNSRYGERQSGTAEWEKLRDDFISLASPDRMGLIQNRLYSLSGQMSITQMRIRDKIEFFDILFANNKKFGSDVGGNFITFRDEEGNEIAEYSTPNGWNVRSTPAERARNHLFFDLWNQALADAQEEMGQESAQEPEIKSEFSFYI